MNAGSEMAWSLARAVTVSSPFASRATTARRTGSASAANVRSRSTVCW